MADAPASLADALPDEPVEPIEDTLTPRQAAFVGEYLIDLNGKAAATRAGYRAVSAAESAVRLLQMPKVAAAVERGKEQRASRVGMTADSVLHEMSLLSHSCIEHYLVDDEGQVKPAPGAPDGAMRAIQSIKRKTHVRYDSKGEETGRTYDVEIRLWDKPAPLKLMGRHVGLFADRIEHTGKGGGPIETVSKIERVVVNGTNTTDTDGASLPAATTTE